MIQIIFIRLDLYPRKKLQRRQNQDQVHRVVAAKAKEKVQRSVQNEKRIIYGLKE